MTIPDQLPILKSGKQSPGSGAVCSEQAISWLVSGRMDLGDETDKPSCVQPVLNALTIAVNDKLPDSRRGEMWPLILRQPGTARPEMEPVLSVRMAAWCAEQVLALASPGDWQVCRDAIVAAQAWCDSPSNETHAAAYAANAAAYAATNAAPNAAANAAAYAANAAHAAAHVYAAHAAHAAAYAARHAVGNAAHAAANAAAYAANAAAYAANAAGGPDRLLKLLSDAQDYCEELTGHVPSEPDIARIERLGELVGTLTASLKADLASLGEES